MNVGSFRANPWFQPTSVGWHLGLTQKLPTLLNPVAISFRVNPLFHPTWLGWYLGLTRKLRIPDYYVTNSLLHQLLSLALVGGRKGHSMLIQNFSLLEKFWMGNSCRENFSSIFLGRDISVLHNSIAWGMEISVFISDLSVCRRDLGLPYTFPAPENLRAIRYMPVGYLNSIPRIW